VIHTRLLKDGTIIKDVSHAAFPEVLADKSLCLWLDLESPSEEELKVLEKYFHLTPLTIEDIGPEPERAKIESFSDYLVMVIHSLEFNDQTNEFTTPELDLILGHNFLISTHHQPINSLGEIRDVEEKTSLAMRQGADFLLYSLVDSVVDAYFPILDKLSDRIDTLEDTIVSKPSPDILTTIFALKRSLVDIRKTVTPQRDIFYQLSREDLAFIKGKQMYFRDVYDHLIRIADELDTYRDLMAGTLDAYLSTVSNNLNEVMKRLTVIATIFMPITFITGVFGMNFAFAPQVEWDSGPFYGWWFWGVLVVMALITLGQIVYFRKKKWM